MLAQEVDRCGPYLLAQLAIIRPKAIVTLGGPATKLLLASELGIPVVETVAVSRGGAKVDGSNTPYGAMPEAKGLRDGQWGKLPKKMAEQMTQGQREAVAGADEFVSKLSYIQEVLPILEKFKDRRHE